MDFAELAARTRAAASGDWQGYPGWCDPLPWGAAVAPDGRPLPEAVEALGVLAGCLSPAARDLPEPRDPSLWGAAWRALGLRGAALGVRAAAAGGELAELGFSDDPALRPAGFLPCSAPLPPCDAVVGSVPRGSVLLERLAQVLPRRGVAVLAVFPADLAAAWSALRASFEGARIAAEGAHVGGEEVEVLVLSRLDCEPPREWPRAVVPPAELAARAAELAAEAAAMLPPPASRPSPGVRWLSHDPPEDDVPRQLGSAAFPAEAYAAYLLSLFPGESWGIAVARLPDGRHHLEVRRPAIAAHELARSGALQHALRATAPPSIREAAMAQEVRAGFPAWAEARGLRPAPAFLLPRRRMDGGTFPVPGPGARRAWPGQARAARSSQAGGPLDDSSMLALEPGGGKTDAALLAALRCRLPALVLAPPGLAGDWRERARELGASAGVEPHSALGRFSFDARALLLGEVADLGLGLPARGEPGHGEAAELVRRAVRSAEAEVARASGAGRAPWPFDAVHLIVDEAHLFKNDGAGGSARALRLRLACWHTLRAGGRVTLLTGTPVSNSLDEAYVWMRMTQPRLLRALGVRSWSAWRATFGEEEAVAEPDGRGGWRSVARARITAPAALSRLLSQNWCWS